MNHPTPSSSQPPCSTTSEQQYPHYANSAELIADLPLPPAGTLLHYQPNPGNGGDALIASATYQLFASNNLELAPSSAVIPAGSDAFFGGGGNLVPAYQHAASWIKKNAPRTRHLTLLPHTIAGHDDLLRSLGENTTIVCREKRSLEHLQQAAPHLDTRLAHDLALDLDTNKVRATRPPRALWRQHLKWVLAGRRAHKDHPGHHLNAYREDVEQTKIPRKNLDISALFYPPEARLDSRPIADLTTRHFLNFLDRYTHIHTNRLHVCIGAALLGKEVTFSANSYFKNQAIYEHSLANRFPNVTWQE